MVWGATHHRNYLTLQNLWATVNNEEPQNNEIKLINMAIYYLPRLVSSKDYYLAKNQTPRQDFTF